MIGSPFATILEDLVRAVPGADGAIFIDWEGEAVDAFSPADEDRMRLIGAHWGIIYNQSRNACDKIGIGAPFELLLRFEDQQVIIRHVTDEYLAIVTLDRGANLGRALGLMRTMEARLREEM